MRSIIFGSMTTEERGEVNLSLSLVLLVKLRQALCKLTTLYCAEESTYYFTSNNLTANGTLLGDNLFSSQ